MNIVITGEQVQETHEFIRNKIIKKCGEEIWNKIRIIFEGNVDVNNYKNIIL